MRHLQRKTANKTGTVKKEMKKTLGRCELSETNLTECQLQEQRISFG